VERFGRLLTSRCAAVCLAALLLVAAAGCGRQEHPAPSLVGDRLDAAIDVLDRAGLDYDTNGGGLLGPIVKSRWVVCRQDPSPGAETKLVVLFVDRDCEPIELPALAGARLDEARRRLTARLASANVEVLDLRSTPVQPARPSAWHVCGVDPSDYVYVGEASVSLYVAPTCPPRTVPDLLGRPLAAALDDVRDFRGDVHVTTVRGRRVDPRRPGRWMVCSQDPEAGDDWLDLVLSSRKAPSFSLVVNLQCVAPNVVGMTLPRATAVLHAGAIQVITVPFEGGVVPDRRRAVVCQQDPVAGESIDETAGPPVVVLYVAQSC
jgi:beta-lactam-binding protein with PASTA domain